MLEVFLYYMHSNGYFFKSIYLKELAEFQNENSFHRRSSASPQHGIYRFNGWYSHQCYVTINTSSFIISNSHCLICLFSCQISFLAYSSYHSEPINANIVYICTCTVRQRLKQRQIHSWASSHTSWKTLISLKSLCMV